MDNYHLIQTTLQGALPIEKLVLKLRENITQQPDLEAAVQLLSDTLAHCDIETEAASQQEQRQTLLRIIKILIKSGTLPVDCVLDRFEFNTIKELEIEPRIPDYAKRCNVIRTKVYFIQKKYNLLREENEGFAKILTKLFMLDATNYEQVRSDVIEIIGSHLVDPNRVLDLVLEVFEFNEKLVDYDVYVNFLKLFYNSPQQILQVVILKLGFYTSTYSGERIIIPQSFYRLIAILIHKEIFEIDDIYPFMTPSDDKVLKYHTKLVDEAKIIAKRYNIAVVGEEKPTKPVIETLSDEERHILEVDNQKINVCAHLIDLGDWSQALDLSLRLPEFYCLSDQSVSKTACDLISYLIDPIYRENALPAPLRSKVKPILPRESPAQIHTVPDLQKRVFPMLTALGPFVSADTLLVTKLIRLLRYIILSVQPDGETVLQSESPLFHQVLDVLNDAILPAMCLIKSNSCLARELWSLVRHLKYQTRYKLYHNWREEGSNPIMLRARGESLLCAKHYMKRLSKDTCRLIGRQLGKLCYSNPVIILNYIIIQIQSYDNLCSQVVEALRFSPPISMDALIYCIIEALSNPTKSKKSHDGMALAPWLTSLSSFSAHLILRYKVEFTSFLEFIANQLKKSNSLDLVLLTDLIQKMTGIETMKAITDDRIEALFGGPVLRSEAASFNQTKNTRKPSARLKDALIESRLAMPLCISIAQLRDSLFFINDKDDAPLKLVGKLYDACQETLVQYGVFLAMNMNIDDYINFLPPIDELFTKYKMDPDSAFFLARPMIFHKIKSKFNELKEEAAKTSNSDEQDNGELPKPTTQSMAIKFVEAARSVIDPIAEMIQPSLLEKYEARNLNTKLFVIFWTFSMCDLEVPVNCYEREIQRLKAMAAEYNKQMEEIPKRRTDRERYSSLVQKLKNEQEEQLEHASYIKMYLESERNNLFCERSSYDQVYLESRQFVQHCAFSRSVLTAHDAVYSARFLMYLHDLKVENYPTIICLDRLLCDLTFMMGACTENEANHFGRFLCNTLKVISYWHSDETIYKNFCENSPGSIINIENSVHITYENYRDICFKWHYRMTKAFTFFLESNNYVQIRNALIVMICIIEYYPAIKHFGKSISSKIEDVRNNEKENRQDLYALATAYAGRLDERRGYLISEGNFHHVDSKRKGENSTNASVSSTNTNSASTTKPPPTNPTTPTNNSTTNGTSSSSSSHHHHRDRHRSSSSSRKRARHS